MIVVGERLTICLRRQRMSSAYNVRAHSIHYASVVVLLVGGNGDGGGGVVSPIRGSCIPTKLNFEKLPASHMHGLRGGCTQ